MGPKNDEWDTKCTTHNKSTKKTLTRICEISFESVCQMGSRDFAR